MNIHAVITGAAIMLAVIVVIGVPAALGIARGRHDAQRHTQENAPVYGAPDSRDTRGAGDSVSHLRLTFANGFWLGIGILATAVMVTVAVRMTSGG